MVNATMSDEEFLYFAGNHFEYSVAEWMHLNEWKLPSEDVLRYLRVKATVDALFDLWQSNPSLAPVVPAARRLYHWRIGVVHRSGTPDDEIAFGRIAIGMLERALEEEEGRREP